MPDSVPNQPALHPTDDLPIDQTLADIGYNEPLKRQTPLDESENERPTLFDAPPSKPEARSNDDFQPGQVVQSEDGRARYEIQKVLHGGMGVVYLSYDLNDGTPIALKSIQTAVLSAGVAGIRERFYHEALTWIQLGKHPHIVQARTIQTLNGRPHIVLECINGADGLGTDLRGWIEHSQIDLTMALQFALQIAWAMDYATTQRPGLVHRDLKPANILVTFDGFAKVTDFGLAYSLADRQIAQRLLNPDTPDEVPKDIRLTRAGTIMGTAAYMSPEQTRGTSVDQRADIYALGVILYEMLVERPPFVYADWEALSVAHQTEAPAFDPIAEKLIPASVRDFTLACLEKRPESRPQTWAAVVTDLTRLYFDQTGHSLSSQTDGIQLELREVMSKAYGLTEIGHIPEALAEYERALQIAPPQEMAHVWARKGRTQRVAGQFDVAIDSLETSLEFDPDFAWTWRQLGVALDKAGRLDEALTAARNAYRLDPRDSWGGFNLAKLLVRKGERDEALPLLTRILDQDPAQAQSHALLGDLLSDMRQDEDALAAYDRAVQLIPHDPIFWKKKGKVLRTLGRLEEAAGALRQAATLDRSDGGAWKWYTLGDTLRELGRYAEALGAAQQALRLNAGYARAWGLQADALLHLKRFPEALNATEQAVRLDPAYSWAHRLRGVLLDRLDQPTEALAAYDRSLEHNGGDVWAWQGRAKVLARIGRRSEALESFGKAASFSSRSIRFWLIQAEELLRVNAPEEAQAAALRARDLELDNGGAWRLLGEALRRRGRYKQAYEAFDRATQLNPADSRAWDGRGQALSRLDELDEALSSFERAIQLAPRAVWYRLHQIEPLMKLGYHAEALDAAEGATRAAPQSIAAWEAVGRVMRRLDRHLDALAAYDRALRYDPDNAEVWRGKAKAYDALGDQAQAAACYQRLAALGQRPS